MIVFILQHYLPEHGAAFELHLLPCCTRVFPFLAQTDTNTIHCYVHFVQIHNVLSAFINKNSCDPHLQRGKKRSQDCYHQVQIQISLMKM